MGPVGGPDGLFDVADGVVTAEEAGVGFVVAVLVVTSTAAVFGKVRPRGRTEVFKTGSVQIELVSLLMNMLFFNS